jgi:hypothetical protein
MVPVPKNTGINSGYLRPGDGIVQFGTGPGVDRGGINWRGIYYRVMGTKLVSISDIGATTILGDVGSGGEVTFDYSFDRLGIAAGGRLYYWNGIALTQVTDSDLGVVIDMVWVDGYFMTTDGTFLIVTELNDPYSVNPLKYGSSEANPDPVVGLLKVRNEVYALNRNTIEVFNNVGGDNFPFARIEGAQIQRGPMGTYAACVFLDSIAFVGSGFNEAPAIWLGSNGQTIKLSSREIDQQLLEYTEAQLAKVIVEQRIYRNHQALYVHLPDQTIVYDAASSAQLGQPVWFQLTSSLVGRSLYRARNIIWVYDDWYCGDPASNVHGRLVDHISTHYDQTIGWDFGTEIVYNAGQGAIFHDLELVCLTGRVAPNTDPVIWTSYTIDGVTWSQERSFKAGKLGDRNRRIKWLSQGYMRNWRAQKFRGTSDAHISIARLEANLEGLTA